MLKVKDYCFPASAEEALAVVEEYGRRAVIVGGGAFLGLGEKRAHMAVDLSRAGLDQVRRKDGCIELGAAVTLGFFETPEAASDPVFRFLKRSLRDVVGIQLRNMATLGGTAAGRFGFSDLLTALMTLDVSVRFTKTGELPFAQFMGQGVPGRDVLEGLRIRETLEAFGYASVRRSTGDFPMLTAAAARCSGQWRIAVGARPGRAMLAQEAMGLLAAHPGGTLDGKVLEDALCSDLPMGSNSRASEGYRRSVVTALVHDALKEAGYEG